MWNESNIFWKRSIWHIRFFLSGSAGRCSLKMTLIFFLISRSGSSLLAYSQTPLWDRCLLPFSFSHLPSCPRSDGWGEQLKCCFEGARMKWAEAEMREGRTDKLISADEETSALWQFVMPPLSRSKSLRMQDEESSLLCHGINSVFKHSHTKNKKKKVKIWHFISVDSPPLSSWYFQGWYDVFLQRPFAFITILGFQQNDEPGWRGCENKFSACKPRAYISPTISLNHPSSTCVDCKFNTVLLHLSCGKQ